MQSSRSDNQAIESLLQRLRQNPNSTFMRQGLWPILASGPNESSTRSGNSTNYNNNSSNSSSNNMSNNCNSRNNDVISVLSDSSYSPYDYIRQNAEQERGLLIRSLLCDRDAAIGVRHGYSVLSGQPTAEFLSLPGSSLLRGNYMENSAFNGLVAATNHPPVEDVRLIIASPNSTSFLPASAYYQHNLAFGSRQVRTNQQFPVAVLDGRNTVQGSPQFDEVVDRPEASGSQQARNGCTQASERHSEWSKSKLNADEEDKAEKSKALECAETREYNAESFAQRLFRMIADQEFAGLHDTVEFLDGGGGFWLHNQEKLVKELMPTYFRARKFSAFRRQLVSYGFKRENSLCPHRGAFKHPLFARDRPDLCKGILRDKRYDRRNRKKKQRNAPPEEGQRLKAELKHDLSTSEEEDESIGSRND